MSFVGLLAMKEALLPRKAEATRLSSMLGMDSTLAGMPSVGGK